MMAMVGAAGFEPATFWSQTRRATRLRYAPPRRMSLPTNRSPPCRGMRHGSLRYTLRFGPARQTAHIAAEWACERANRIIETGSVPPRTEPGHPTTCKTFSAKLLSVRRRPGRALGAHLGCHQAFRPGPKADQDELARPQFGDAVAPQRLHVHEDVGRPFPAGQEAETAQPVEPLHLRPLQPAGRGHRHMRAWRWQLRWMDRCRFIHRDDAERLQAARPLQHLDDNPGAFVGGLETVAPQARDMQENIRQPVVWHDETVSLGYVKPFDDAAELDNARYFIVDIADRIAISIDT